MDSGVMKIFYWEDCIKQLPVFIFGNLVWIWKEVLLKFHLVVMHSHFFWLAESLHFPYIFHFLITAITWLKYRRYDVKHYPINQSINQSYSYNKKIYEYMCVYVWTIGVEVLEIIYLRTKTSTPSPYILLSFPSNEQVDNLIMDTIFWEFKATCRSSSIINM